MQTTTLHDVSCLGATPSLLAHGLPPRIEPIYTQSEKGA